MTLRLNLGGYLQANGLTAYRIAQESKGELAPNTVYAIAKKPAQRIDLDTLAKIIQILTRLQQKEVKITDLIQVFEEPQSEPEAAFNAATIKPFTYRPRENKPRASRPIQEVVTELRDRN